MRKLSVKFHRVLASGRDSDADTESPWLIVVQMYTLHGHCDVTFEKKKNMFPLLFLTHPLPCVGSVY